MQPAPRVDAASLERMEADGLLRRDGEVLRTTRRWQAAMARAAVRLLHHGDAGDDLRVPIASALIELYGDDVNDDDVTRMVEAVLPIEAREIEPQGWSTTTG